MITVTEAEEIIKNSIKHFDELDSEMLSLGNSLGRILAEDIYPERSLPPFNRATMDGYAIRLNKDKPLPAQFEIKGTQYAGKPKETNISDQECIEIMTGAVIPSGLNCVIPIERTHLTNDQIEIHKNYIPRRFQYIHQEGTDINISERLLSIGEKIDVPDLLSLAASGQENIKVKRLPRIALFVTGDEIKPIGEPIELHEIRSTSQYGIEGAIKKIFLSNITINTLGDNFNDLESSINKSITSHDIIILTGGVSMGKKDHVKNIIANLPDFSGFHKVLQKPGLPFMFAGSNNGQLIFGLPGNPVSSMICLYRYIIPAIKILIGQSSSENKLVKLTEKVTSPSDLSYFLPVKLLNAGDHIVKAKPLPTNTSGDFITLAKSDGFIEISPASQTNLLNALYPFTSW
jgi:molybdopterin molybdotransferase